MLYAPVALAGVVKRYGARPALDGFDLRVAHGEVFGFLGPNGAGKTTAIRIALGLLRPDAGSVRVLGRDPWIDGVAERARIGYLPSGPRFYDRMRGVDLLDHLAALGGGRIPGRGRALDLLELSRADLARPIREYSRGMRQKLGIVQAVQHEPELLVLDEPVTALDGSIQAQIVNLLADLQARLGLAYLFIAHDLAVVHLGRIVESADRAALFAAPAHPYTEALLSASPVPDPERERTLRRIVLSGELPDAQSPPSGCRFRTRCWKPTPACAEDPGPELVDRGQGHPVACLFPDSPPEPREVEGAV